MPSLWNHSALAISHLQEHLQVSTQTVISPTMCGSLCWCMTVLHRFWGGVFGWLELSWMHQVLCMHVCGQCASELVEGKQFLLPAVDSSGTKEAWVKNCSLEPTLRSCFLSSRPLLLVLLSYETREFPSFIYIITLKVFIDCDWGPLSLLSLRLCKFSSHSLSSHILPSNSSISSLCFL